MTTTGITDFDIATLQARSTNKWHKFPPDDCRALELPSPAGQFFLDQARVGLNFGETFGADYLGFARLNFATPATILREIAITAAWSR